MFVWLLFSSSRLLASVPTCDLVAVQVFEKAFSDKTCYSKFECRENTYRLVQRLFDAKQDLSKAEVVHVLGRYGLFPNQPRPLIHEWTYHVFLIKDGQVLDMDYTQSPVIATVADYYPPGTLADLNY